MSDYPFRYFSINTQQYCKINDKIWDENSNNKFFKNNLLQTLNAIYYDIHNTELDADSTIANELYKKLIE